MTSTTPTPETDKLQDAFNNDDNAATLDAYIDMAEHARSLERQRDAALREIREWSHVIAAYLCSSNVTGITRIVGRALYLAATMTQRDDKP